MVSRRNRRPDYGLDAPPVIRNLAIVGTAIITIGLPAYLLVLPLFPALAVGLALWAAMVGFSMLLTAALMIWSSRRGKLYMRDKIIDSLHLHGDETVLEVGRGRGLLLLAAAKHLTTGRAIGVDLWISKDQALNSPDALLANARLERVADRIDTRTADMRSLPLKTVPSMSSYQASRSITSATNLAVSARSKRSSGSEGVSL